MAARAKPRHESPPRPAPQGASVLVYGGGPINYAGGFVHYRLDVRHKVGQAQYVGQPLRTERLARKQATAFKRVHVVTVPPEFLEVDDPKTQLRFSQLNAKEMAKADPVATPRAAPYTFDDFDQHTLVALAHVEHQPGAGTTWTELTSDEIDDLLCLEWLAGEIYDVSKPKSAKERENTF